MTGDHPSAAPDHHLMDVTAHKNIAVTVGRRHRVVVEPVAHLTAEANSEVPDIEGQILSCPRCGICYPSLAYDQSRFGALYAKSLGDLIYLDDSIIQKVRRHAITRLLRRPLSRHGLLSSALQIPIGDPSAAGLSVLDVGCGFGEFSAAYRELGANVTATEVIPQLVERVRRQGIDCRLGALEELGFAPNSFDLILFRGVLYRTSDPAGTIAHAKRLLRKGGRISVLDPCPGLEGVDYFAHKQFPQGRYYVCNVDAFAAMLKRQFGLAMIASHAIYGRPRAPLKQVRFFGNVIGFAELVWNNLARRKAVCTVISLGGCKLMSRPQSGQFRRERPGPRPGAFASSCSRAIAGGRCWSACTAL